MSRATFLHSLGLIWFLSTKKLNFAVTSLMNSMFKKLWPYITCWWMMSFQCHSTLWRYEENMVAFFFDSCNTRLNCTLIPLQFWELNALKLKQNVSSVHKRLRILLLLLLRQVFTSSHHHYQLCVKEVRR